MSITKIGAVDFGAMVDLGFAFSFFFGFWFYVYLSLVFSYCFHLWVCLLVWLFSSFYFLFIYF